MWPTVVCQRSALAVLGLRENTPYTEAELKSAFRLQAKTLHPDAGGSAERFRELHDAYASLLKNMNKNDHHNNLNGNGNSSKWKKETASDANEYSSETSEGGAFYNNAHSRWSTHQQAEYGGLGSAFARNDTYGGTYANNSTRDFYRPYTSHPFAHGFTAEEVLEAERLNRLRVARVIFKHGILWSGIVYFLFLYFRENRIHRAIEARNKGYLDESYWQKQQEDHRRGLSYSPKPHWTETTSEDFMQTCDKDMERKKRASQSLFLGGTSSLYAMRPVAISFQGRPFTATGVRGDRSGVPKKANTYEDDTHYEPDDMMEN
ncbi:putative chaperone DNAJ protein [Trypanosoma theileri]|uniref:Putative chaperone DNAJ protein n=1 Tax=Trypanosoma theileri TaxID=67003 RepID=A0A1X0NJW8_9TRYP|nr:putative chaperone DNAJ protein [Trypanosoma theileri]ORC84753.1 putative chaperone DNAJ protein [Trypanosoma theileri]